METIIYRFCKSYGLSMPRRYRRRARKDYLAFAKSKKHSEKKTRSAQGIIRNGCWLAQYTGREKTELL